MTAAAAVSCPLCGHTVIIIVMSTTRGKPLTVALGKILHQIGLLSLPVGLGAVAGFYAADQGMRWMPTMLESVLAVFVLGFASMPFAS